LAAVAGVESVVVRLQPGEADIEGLPAASALLAAVQDEGYTAEVVQATAR
jgi:copper chaperone CopZ